MYKKKNQTETSKGKKNRLYSIAGLMMVICHFNPESDYRDFIALVVREMDDSLNLYLRAIS
ncbi:hypothetical protein [Neobacillus bataviensis]|uniref:hypothetical protein n=1 Tax=Neobacillus bataviensis TaxID=220685 RepID=UPI0005916E1A|nr:hypothetical protein [Neobacillus bataviensis]